MPDEVRGFDELDGVLPDTELGVDYGPGIEVLTPRYLHDIGMGGAIMRDPLARVIAQLQDEYGLLTESQLDSVIQGFEQGTRERKDYDRDMKEFNQTHLPDDQIPF